MKTKCFKATQGFIALLSVVLLSEQLATTGTVLYAHAEEVALDYSVQQSITSDWGVGCNAEITLTNLTNAETENWTIIFSSADRITNLWNGNITETAAYADYYQYTVVAADYNKVIASGQSVSIGYISEGQVHDFVDARVELFFADSESVALDSEQATENETESTTENETEQEEVNGETKIYISDSEGNPVPATVKLYAGWGDLETFFLTLTNVNDTDGSVSEYIALTAIPDGIYVARITANGYKEVITQVNAIQTLQVTNICMEKETSSAAAEQEIEAETDIRTKTSRELQIQDLIDRLRTARSEAEFRKSFYFHIAPEKQVSYEYFVPENQKAYGFDNYCAIYTSDMYDDSYGCINSIARKYTDLSYYEWPRLNGLYYLVATKGGTKDGWNQHLSLTTKEERYYDGEFDSESHSSYIYSREIWIDGNHYIPVKYRTNVPVFKTEEMSKKYSDLMQRYWTSRNDVYLKDIEDYLTAYATFDNQ